MKLRKLAIEINYRRAPHIRPSWDWAWSKIKKDKLPEELENPFKNSRALLVEKHAYKTNTEMKDMPRKTHI